MTGTISSLTILTQPPLPRMGYGFLLNLGWIPTQTIFLTVFQGVFIIFRCILCIRLNIVEYSQEYTEYVSGVFTPRGPLIIPEYEYSFWIHMNTTIEYIFKWIHPNTPEYMQNTRRIHANTPCEYMYCIQCPPPPPPPPPDRLPHYPQRPKGREISLSKARFQAKSAVVHAVVVEEMSCQQQHWGLHVSGVHTACAATQNWVELLHLSRIEVNWCQLT